jgi:hypothetical protein
LVCRQVNAVQVGQISRGDATRERDFAPASSVMLLEPNIFVTTSPACAATKRRTADFVLAGLRYQIAAALPVLSHDAG